MKLVLVTDDVAKLIERISTDNGYNEQMESVCAAMTSAIHHLVAAEDYCADGLHPLGVIADYSRLLEELSKSEEPNELLTKHS